MQFSFDRFLIFVVLSLDNSYKIDSFLRKSMRILPFMYLQVFGFTSPRLAIFSLVCGYFPQTRSLFQGPGCSASWLGRLFLVFWASFLVPWFIISFCLGFRTGKGGGLMLVIPFILF